MNEERVPWDHCVDCGEPIWRRPKSPLPRCYYCAAVKHGVG